MAFMRKGFFFYLSGILIMTLGIALTIISGLGASPFDSLLVGLHRTFGLTIGSWEIVVGLVLILGNAVLKRERPEYFALLTSFFTGIGIDAWLFFIEGWGGPMSLFGQFAAMMLGVVLMGLGIAAYLQSAFAPNPLDRSMLVLSELTGWNIAYTRALINLFLVAAAFYFGGALGVGTLINAFLTGLFIKWFLPYIAAMKKRKLEEREGSIAS